MPKHHPSTLQHLIDAPRSIWQMPVPKELAKLPLADVRDSFLLGGDGYISARLGVRDRVSTLERIMAPYLSSYNFGENNNFRMDRVTPSRDFYPPFTFTPTASEVWRVKGTAIIVTREVDAQYELTTVNAVHPELHALLRHVTLRNISKKPIADIGISFEAIPDIPFPVQGHRSVILPLSKDTLSERLEELTPAERDYGQHYTDRTQRFRYIVRSVPGAKNRGYQDLFKHTERLAPGETLEAVHILAPALDDTEDSAIRAMNHAKRALDERGIARLFDEVREFWQHDAEGRATFETSEPIFTELIENNIITQRCYERATGGWTVIDDYTGSWLRDHNGSHILMLDAGRHDAVKRSMDRYYGLDCSGNSLYSVYASDLEPKQPVPPEPDWLSVDGFITGDVPNFRTMCYAWYFKHTGDLEFVRERFEYMKGAFMRQKLHESGYLAEYCFDETYGIGPIGAMRTGLSADNSFNALAAADHLAYFAHVLGREDQQELKEYAAKIRTAIESTFWLKREKYHAMRVTPEGKIDKTPLSVGLLCPLWIDSSTAEDEHAVRSALYAYEKLSDKNGFIRLIPSHDQTVTMMIGYMLFAMKKIGHPEIDRVINDTLKWADASGTFGEYLDDTQKGPQQCYEHMAHRNRMWESGINTDALIFALTGFDPFAFEQRVTVAPYLPKGWKHVTSSRLRVGNARLSLKSERIGRKLSHSISGDAALQVTWKLNADSDAKRVSVNGVQLTPEWKRTVLGRYTAELLLELMNGETIVVEE